MCTTSSPSHTRDSLPPSMPRPPGDLVTLFICDPCRTCCTSVLFSGSESANVLVWVCLFLGTVRFDTVAPVVSTAASGKDRSSFLSPSGSVGDASGGESPYAGSDSETVTGAVGAAPDAAPLRFMVHKVGPLRRKWALAKPMFAVLEGAEVSIQTPPLPPAPSPCRRDSI